MKDDKKLSFYCESKNFKKHIKKSQKPKKQDVLQIIDDRIVINTDNYGVEENDHITSRTYATKKHKKRRWSKEENERFFESLRCCGLEFSMISTLFQNCTRKDIKNKYKRELKINKSRIDDALGSFKKFDSENFYKLKADGSLNNTDANS